MKLDVTIDGDLGLMMKGQIRAGERAVSAAMRDAGGTLKGQWRAQVARAGLGQRLANSVRLETYPKGRPSLKAAAMVFSKAPKILAVNETGAVIRAHGADWLAIPLPAAGSAGRGGKMTTAKWQQKNGRVLRFVYLQRRVALLVDDGTKAPGNVMVRRKVKGGYVLSEPRTFKNRVVPMFILVPQVSLKKRLNLYKAGEAVGNLIPGLIVANWRGDE